MESPTQKFVLAEKQFEYKGIQFGKQANPEILDRFPNLKFRNTDVVITTFPKCGTTVVQEIVWQIRNSQTIEKDVQYGDMFKRFPFIEYNTKIRKPDEPLSIDVFENDNSDKRLVKTHCPLSIFDSPDGSNSLYDPKKGTDNPKLVLVIRNPFDAAVSFFHFYQVNPAISWQGSWEDFFELFLHKMTIYGSFLDWYLTYWRIIKSGEAKNLLLVKYEDVVLNMKDEVKKIAKFLGEEPTEEQLEIIVHNCSFKSMSKEGENNVAGAFASKFFRKGEVGDYKNYFTPEQFLKFEENIVKVLKAEGLEFDY